jgi:DnaJ-class molecular chaperone
VFDLARELTGCLTTEHREDWIDWIAKVRENLRNRATVGDCERCGVRGIMVRPTLIASDDANEPTVEQLLCTVCRGTGGFSREARRCTACGGLGHNRTSCPLNINNIKMGRAVREP